MQKERPDIRNIAIIAHVDHGKTTLMDGLLRQSNVFAEHQAVIERVMDSNDLERERGITILSKNTAVVYHDKDSGRVIKINIIDTPGHADFGGEVERVLNMVDGVLLLVDAAEGPMPQTRFVLKKALAIGLKAIVVINKIDRKDAEPQRALNETFDLFIELGANEIQADFPVVYCNAVEGISGLSPDSMQANLEPLFQTIVHEIPGPIVDMDAPFQMLAANLGYDDHLGVTCLGRVFAGKVKESSDIVRMTLDDRTVTEKVKYLFVFDGIKKKRAIEVEAGDIAFIAGIQDISIGETLAHPENPVALPRIYVEEPTVKMSFEVNNSPFSGRSGKFLTTRQIRDRLFREIRNNVALRVEETEFADRFMVSGRGELHLAILIETMRRESYEFQVSRPEVIYKQGDHGQTLEPFEEAIIETIKESVGSVVELFGTRRGKLLSMENRLDGVVLRYLIPTRGLLGLRQHFMTLTRGQGIIHTIFSGYEEYAGDIPSRSTSSLVSWETGVTSTYGLKNAEERGTLFIGAGVDVYEGMVFGETYKESDITVNICKKKHLTNMRSSNKDMEYRLTTPRTLSLDEALEFLADDELLEVTPDTFRIRKRILNTEDRGKNQKKSVLLAD
ncbi:MAG: translational GTPase TypA [Chloroflexi bacterium HGW-Chloroflexi-10]|nr:MAG: translational GTPase TypA [Chloroflexi bacterium HGW-Chloroflexi-10]